MKHLLTLLVLPVVLMVSSSPGAPKTSQAQLPTTSAIQAPAKAKTVRAKDLPEEVKPQRPLKKKKKAVALKNDKPAGDKVTLVRIDKSDHKLEVLAGKQVLKSYKVAIGIGGMGPKQFEGDMTTPVGHYKVTTRFRPLFHQFIGVSYPNDEDRARYAELKRQGKVPAGRGVGHGIGIHGVGSRKLSGVHKQEDWTHGCIAMDDDEIDEFGRLVPEGTPIEIVD